jgi:hypothetical protein
MLPGGGRSPTIPSSCCMTGSECAGMVRASIKASALPLLQASAVRSTRLSCCRTALMEKPGMSAYREQRRDARLHARQGGVASIGDATRRTQVSVGVHPRSAKIDGAIQRSNHAPSLGDAPSGNSSRRWEWSVKIFVVKRRQAITSLLSGTRLQRCILADQREFYTFFLQR